MTKRQVSKRSAALACPCGTGDSYAACCRPLHRGETSALTAEQLMRSRYSAYAKRLNEYVLETWHPDTRPVELGDDAHTRWSGLEITDVVDGLPGDDAGIVQFIARYQQQREQHQLAERSRFVFVEGRWLYVSGDILD